MSDDKAIRRALQIAGKKSRNALLKDTPGYDPKRETFLRFGDVPPGERSKNHITGGRERGVSVYALNPKGGIVRPAGDIGEASIRLIESLGVGRTVMGEKKPALKRLLVQGRQIGEGQDDEPVIRDITELPATWHRPRRGAQSLYGPRAELEPDPPPRLDPYDAKFADGGDVEARRQAMNIASDPIKVPDNFIEMDPDTRAAWKTDQMAREGNGSFAPPGTPEREENFNRWFTHSKMRDREGKPMRLYHITPKSFDWFIPGGPKPDDEKPSGPATWLSPYPDRQPAGHHVGGHEGQFKSGANVMPVHADIRNPLVIDSKDMRDWAKSTYGADISGFPLLISPKARQLLLEDGYDGIIWAGSKAASKEEAFYDTHHLGEHPDKEEEIIALHPPERAGQIKSAIGNRGQYDPDDPHVNFAKGGPVEPHPLTQDVYHGTQAEFPSFRDGTTKRGEYMPSLMLGTHVARDPAIASNEYFTNRDPDKAGHVLPLKTYGDEKFFEIPQRKPNGAMEHDDYAVEKAIKLHAFQHHPDMLALALMQGHGMQPEEAIPAAEGMVEGKELRSPMGTYNSLHELVYDPVYAPPFPSPEARVQAVKSFRDHLIDQGYAGVKYINTADDETAGAKNKACYIVFNKPTKEGYYPLRGRFAAMNPEDKADPDLMKSEGGFIDKAEGGPIDAYHGSPYDFDRFDFSKIGTGEGAQVYGHGIYLADEPNVAASYMQSRILPVTDEMNGVRAAKMMYERRRTGPQQIDYAKKQLVRLPPQSHGEAIQSIYDDLTETPEKAHIHRHTLNALKAFEASGKWPDAGYGRLYDVRLHADPESLLDLDKPLADQSAKVKKALALRPTNTGIGGGPKLYSESTGMYIPDKPSIARSVIPTRDKGATAAMEKAGVPGLKYLDAFSRGAGDGSRNYVVFPTDKDILEITRKRAEGGKAVRSAVMIAKKHQALLRRVANIYQGPRGGMDPSPGGGGYAGPGGGKYIGPSNYAKGGGVPPEPGKANLPKGRVRRFHYTNAKNVPHILKEGLRIDKSTGRSVGDPVAVWSTPDNPYEHSVPDGKALVEFHDSPEPYTRNPYASPHSVPPENIMAVHLPWHSHYRYALQEGLTPEDLRNVQGDEYQQAADALERVKRATGGRTGHNGGPELDEVPPFQLHSGAAKLIAAKGQPKATPQQYAAIPGIKPDELKFAKFTDLPAKAQPREEVIKHLEANKVPIKETTYTGDNPRSALGRWGEKLALPGGTNYREVLLHKTDDEFDTAAKAARDAMKAFKAARDAYHTSIGRHGINSPETVAADQQVQEARATYQAANNRVAAVRRRTAQDSYQSSHWEDVPNVLAHIRMHDRRGPNGEKILHVEELQSDWGQQGREKGFANSEERKQRLEEARAKMLATKTARDEHVANIRARVQEEYNQRLPNMDPQAKRDLINAATKDISQYHLLMTPEEKDKYERLHGEHNDAYMDFRRAEDAGHGVPRGPYVDNTQKWTDLALKRVLHEAAHGGYDKVVFTPGEEQNKRYSLSKKVDELHYDPTSEYLIYKPKGREHPDSIRMPAEKLPEAIGKEMAEKLLSTPPKKNEWSGSPFPVHSMVGNDLEMGGSGMRGYYDNIMPKRLQALAKQHDPKAQVKLHEHDLSERPADPFEEHKQHYADSFQDFEGRPHANDAELRNWARDFSQEDFRGVDDEPIEAARLHSLDVTPQMRQSIKANGFSQFKRGGYIAARPANVDRALQIVGGRK